VEQARAEVRDVPNIGKIELVGTQDEVLYLNFSTRKLAALGIDQRQVMQALQSQNAQTPAGVIEAGPERISVRTTGQFASKKTCKPSTCDQRPLLPPGRYRRHRARLRRPAQCSAYNGQTAIGLAIGMKAGGNIQVFVRR
jgi:multidrug efflux pump subunit AcrB